MKKWVEKIIENIIKLSGSLTSFVILLIIIFLFKEGLNLFNSPSIEKGYVIMVAQNNPVNNINPDDIKNIFDGNINNWEKVGGENKEITPIRFDDLLSMYSEDQIGENYEHIPQIINQTFAQDPNAIIVIPQNYCNKEIKGHKINVKKVTPSSFFLGKEWYPTSTPVALYGTLPLILGTLLVSLIAMLIATPLGIAVAIYLAELSSENMHKIMKPLIELLSGIPSVVYGFFGLVVIVPLIQRFFEIPVGETALAGSIVLAIMALPTIITIAEDAIRSTPRDMKEASLALGATHWQTIHKIIIPYSISGIMAAVVLGIGRAIGETMAVLMVTGNAAVMPNSILAPIRTIPATIAAELGETASGGTHYKSLFLLGCVLFIITLIISISAEFISNKKQK